MSIVWDDTRCHASSWRDKPIVRNGEDGEYGPGGYNRCVRKEGHPHFEFHVDEFGNVFRFDSAKAKATRISFLEVGFTHITNITPQEVEMIAAGSGTLMTEGAAS